MTGLYQSLFGTNVIADPRQRRIVPERPELGPRIAGPGFAMRWIRRPFYFGTIANGPSWIESTDPAKDYARHFLPIEQIARECIQHDRLAILHRARRDLPTKMPVWGASSIIKRPALYRQALRAIGRYTAMLREAAHA